MISLSRFKKENKSLVRGLQDLIRTANKSGFKTMVLTFTWEDHEPHVVWVGPASHPDAPPQRDPKQVAG